MTYCYPILSVVGVVQRGGTFGHYSIFFQPIWILKKHNLWTAWPRRHFSDKRNCAWVWCTKRLLPKFWIHDPLVRGSSGIFWKEDRLYTRSEYSLILTGPSQRQKCIVRTCTLCYTWHLAGKWSSWLWEAKNHLLQNWPSVVSLYCWASSRQTENETTLPPPLFR